ncbi:MAG: polysaccharide biosynthesis tyrosine autokinase [Patulibacter sp.]
MTDSPSGASGRDAAAARLVRRVLAQWPLIVGCTLVAAVAGYVASSSRPNAYSATTTVQLNDIDLASVFLAQNLQQQGQDAQTKAATAAKLALLPKVREEAAKAVGHGVTAEQLKDAISVSPQASTTLIDITASAKSPELAAAQANAIRDAFIDSRQEANASTLRAARERVQRQLDGLSQVQRSSAAGQTLQSRLDQIDTLIVTAGAGVTTVQPAVAPDRPSSPLPMRDAILALLAGGLLGLGIAVLRARLDDRIRDESELGEHWDLPVLGLIPQTSALVDTGASLPAPAALEAFALARTNLRYLHAGGDTHTVVITSALPGEGKSTVSWNLALAAALAEQRVLLVEADLRRPVLADRLGLPAARGLSELLAGLASPEEVVRRVEVMVPGASAAAVDVVTAGFVPPSPIALLERESTAHALSRLAAGYDLMLIDTPPATVVADAKVLLPQADGALVVSRLNKVTSSALDRLRDVLSGLDTPVLGTIVNAGHAAKSYGYESYGSTPARAAASDASGLKVGVLWRGWLAQRGVYVADGGAVGVGRDRDRRVSQAPLQLLCVGF